MSETENRVLAYLFGEDARKHVMFSSSTATNKPVKQAPRKVGVGRLVAAHLKRGQARKVIAKRSAALAHKVIVEPTVVGHHVLLNSGVVNRLAEKLAVDQHLVLRVADISQRTFDRRKEDEKPFSAAESDRLMRVARVTLEAERVFGDSAKARRWLSAKSSILGAAPIELLGTDAGSRDVESELVRIDYGDFA